MKFRRKQLVRHVKTGSVYRIVHTPDAGLRMERMNEPAYAYKLVEMPDGTPARGPQILWVRDRAEMEDGRFEAI